MNINLGNVSFSGVNIHVNTENKPLSISRKKRIAEYGYDPMEENQPPSTTPLIEEKREAPSLIITPQTEAPKAVQKALAKSFIKSLGWEKHAGNTLRQILLSKYINEHKKKMDVDELEAFFQTASKILFSDLQPTIFDLNVTPFAKEANVLMKQRAYLDVCISEICDLPKKYEPKWECTALCILDLSKTVLLLIYSKDIWVNLEKNEEIAKLINLKKVFSKNIKLNSDRTLKNAYKSFDTKLRLFQIFQKRLINSNDNLLNNTLFDIIDLFAFDLEVMNFSKRIHSYLRSLTGLITQMKAIKLMVPELTIMAQACGMKANININDLGNELSHCQATLEFVQMLSDMSLNFYSSAQLHLRAVKKQFIKVPDPLEEFAWLNLMPAPEVDVRETHEVEFDEEIPEAEEIEDVQEVKEPSKSIDKPKAEESFHPTQLSIQHKNFRKMICRDVRKMKTFSEIDLAKDSLKEFKHHMHYAAVGLKQLYSAVQKNNWRSLGEIVPMLLLDWGVQLEQLISIPYLKIFNEIPLQHSLMHRAKQAKIYEKLPPETQHYLQKMEKAVVGARYPVFSIQSFEKDALELPVCLKMIRLSFILMHQSFKTEEEARKVALELVQGIGALYAEQINHVFTIVSTLAEKPNENWQIKSFTKQAKDFSKILEELVQNSNMSPVSHEVAIGEFENELKSLNSSLEVFLKECPNTTLLKDNNPLVPLKEAMGHVSRLLIDCNIAATDSHPGHSAWLFRSFLRISYIFEQLYRARALVKGHGYALVHDFKFYHKLLKDPVSLEGTFNYSLGKGIHYTSAKNVERKSLIDQLNKLEKKVKRFVGVDEGFVLPNRKGKGNELEIDIHEEIHCILAEALPLLKQHVNLTLAELKQFEKSLNPA